MKKIIFSLIGVAVLIAMGLAAVNTPLVLAAPVTAFSDDFESDFSKWDDNGITPWTIQIEHVHSGSSSAEIDNNNSGYLTSDDIDLSDATAADLDFWFHKRYLNNDEFELYFWDGGSYNLIASLDAQGSDNTWLHWNQVSIDLGTYGISNFRIRFYGESTSDQDWATVDELVLTKTVGEMICDDGFDNDSDGFIDCADSDCMVDNDGDSYYAEPCGTDCDDSDAAINPGAAEVCDDGKDNDCDTLVDCADSDCMVDNDGDSYYAEPCGTDCDDTDDTVNPGAAEVCDDGIDNDCDGLIDCTDPDCPSNIKVQLAMVLDGSGSINSSEWSIMVNGLAAAVESSVCVPRDCSVELTVVQFGGTQARVEVGPVVITPLNAATVANQIRLISKIGSSTPLACGIYRAADTLKNSPNFDPDIKQAINIVTDGVANVCCVGYTGSSCSEGNAKTSAVVARNYLITTLQMTESQDEIDAEGVGITNVNRDWLKDNIVWPQPGYIAPPFMGPGWVRVVADFQVFADTICEKFALITNPNIKLTKMATDGVNEITEACVGDTITYVFEVENTGDVDLFSVNLTDSTVICDSGPVRGTDKVGNNDNTLELSEIWTYSCTHLVTEVDPDPLVNNAMVEAEDSENRTVTAYDAATVGIVESCEAVAGDFSICEGTTVNDALFGPHVDCNGPECCDITSLNYGEVSSNFDNPGTYSYTVTCGCDGVCGSDTETGYVTVVEACEAVAGNFSICAGATVNDALFGPYVGCNGPECCDITSLNYGEVSSNFDNPGTYSYTVTCGCDGVCDPDTETGYVTVVEVCEAVAPDFSICEGTTVNDQLFKDKGASCSVGCNMTLSYSFDGSTAGVYSYNVTCNGGTCGEDVDTGDVTVISMPTPSAPDVTLCTGYTQADLEAAVAAVGGGCDLGTTTITDNGDGTYTVTCDNQGCVAEATGNIIEIVCEECGAIAPNFSICVETPLDDALFISQGAGCSMADGCTMTDLDYSGVDSSEPGTYSYTVTCSDGVSSDTDTGTVTVLPAPTADFTVDKTSGCAPLTVVFTDQSTGNPTSWSWSFPGGSPSSATGQGPHEVTYDSPGTYTVTLTVSNDCGSDSETKINYITVEECVCQYDLTVTSDGCCSITVGDLGTVDPGTTETFSVACNTDVTLNANETECCNFVNWTGDVPGGSNSTSPITIHVDSDKSVTGHCTGIPAPIANFSADPTSGCAPLTVDFTDTSTGNPTSWSWSFPGGNPSSATGQGPYEVTYNSPGTYDVTLTVSNACGSDTETKIGYITAEDCAPPRRRGGVSCPETNYLTVDWEGNSTTKTLYRNDRLAVDLLGPSSDLSHHLLLERGTHAPIVDERTHYLIVVRELEETEIPHMTENRVALVACNITPAGAIFDKDIFLTLGLDELQLSENILEETITMAYYDDISGVWGELEYEAGGPSGVAELTLSAAINHFSIFGVLAELAPPPPQAHFKASGLSIVPSVEKIWETVTFVTKTGERVTITANVANDSGQEGTYTVVLKLDGETVDTEIVTLDAGQSQPVSFTVSGLDYGQHEVEVAELSDEFTTSRTITWWLIILIIVAIGLIIWGVVWGRRRRRRAAQEG